MMNTMSRLGNRDGAASHAPGHHSVLLTNRRKNNGETKRGWRSPPRSVEGRNVTIYKIQTFKRRIGGWGNEDDPSQVWMKL